MSDIVIKRPDGDEIRKRGILDWPVWEKEVSRFDWEYDGDEECLILEGEVDVEAGGKTYRIKEGDFVTFKKGLRCVWDNKSDIRKHYNFP